MFGRRGVVLLVDVPPPAPPPLFLLPPLRSEEQALQPPPPPPAPRLLPVPLAGAISFVRPIIAPGSIMPPRGIGGGYREPRPFAAGPANGLVPQRGEAPAPVSQVAPVQEPAAPKPPTPPKVPEVPVVPVLPEPPPRQAPAAAAPAPHAAGSEARPKARPDCGHPGQPPCHP